MADDLTAVAFHAATGVEDWRVLVSGPHARYRCAGLADGVRFAARIAEAAERIGVAPDLDLRADGVTIRLQSAETDRISLRELALAQAIGAIAAQLGLVAEPSRVQVVNLAVAHAPGVDVRPFWAAALGYDPVGDEGAIDPNRRNPFLWFHPIRSGRPGRGRTHVDLSLPADQAEARVAAAVAAGGVVVDDSHAPDWWTLASPDRHGVDIAGWSDTDDG
ncbi:VOC family protein [uncultured Amnibacterium sp.]|uniref:VOC family protein n=1 Tax=uncultured Amnibacterium sp. TaxID=1631851 RepID=UPI0035CB7963